MATFGCTGFRWVRSDKFYNPNVGKGAVLFNGPNGTRDHKTKLLYPYAVGIGAISKEGTSNIEYVLRAARGCPHPRPRSGKVGEIGWEVSSIREDHTRLLKSGHQIKRGEHRLACDLRHTHLYQNPWYPPRLHQQISVIDLKKSKDAKYRIQTRPAGSCTSMSTSSSSTNIQKIIPMR